MPVVGIKAGSGVTGISFEEFELVTATIGVEFEVPAASNVESGV